MATPGRTTVFVTCTFGVAVSVLAVWWSFSGPRSWPAVGVLAVLCVIGAQARVRSLGHGADLSINSIVQLTAILLTGPVGAMLVGGSSWLLELGRNRPPLRVRAFNLAVAVLITAGASGAYLLVGGQLDITRSQTPGQLVVRVALPLIAANVVMCLLNAVLLAAVVSMHNALPYRETVGDILRGGGLAYVGYGVFGLLLAVVWDAAGVGPMAAVLVLAPLFIARWAFAQYADERAAHDRTVAALVQAVEAKDHYTRGHSERVAKASVLIGRTVALPAQRTATLHFAGMLHDVGKIGVPTAMLRRTGALTDEEFAAIARHPVQGLELVREIEFLGEAFEGILHHHERMDGRGYPMGLMGEAIPEFARIIAVADAFDSMTSTRSYRQAREVDEAVLELRRCAGSQFDSEFVEALAHGLERTEWEPTRVASPVDDDVPAADVLAAVDHDDPRVAVPAPREYRRGTPSTGMTPSGASA
ncbi:MAG TPA: HD-GYP domain-containing protein [Actinomycetales bacterium]|nr:HD-GYP domain-containing protein [Actinomycetales bacterium]